MIKNEIDAHNAALLSNQGKAENLKRCLEEIYTKIKKQTSKGENFLLLFYDNPKCKGDGNNYTKEVIEVITNILLSQGYSVEIDEDRFYYSSIYIKW